MKNPILITCSYSCDLLRKDHRALQFSLIGYQKRVSFSPFPIISSVSFPLCLSNREFLLLLSSYQQRVSSLLYLLYSDVLLACNVSSLSSPMIGRNIKISSLDEWKHFKNKALIQLPWVSYFSNIFLSFGKSL